MTSSWGTGDILLYSTHTGQLLNKCVGHQRLCRSFSADKSNSSLFLSSSYDKTIKLWDTRVAPACTEDPFRQTVSSWSAPGPTPLQCVLSLNQHRCKVVDAHYIDNTPYVISASTDRSIKLWDLRYKGACVYELATSHSLCSLRLSPSCNHIAVNALYGKVFVFDVAHLLHASPQAAIEPRQVLYGHMNHFWGTYRAYFSPDENLIVASKLKLLHFLKCKSDCFSPMSLASEDGRIVAWDVHSGKLMQSQRVHFQSDWVWDCAFGGCQWGGDGLLFTCSDDGTISILQWAFNTHGLLQQHLYEFNVKLVPHTTRPRIDQLWIIDHLPSWLFAFVPFSLPQTYLFVQWSLAKRGAWASGFHSGLCPLPLLCIFGALWGAAGKAMPDCLCFYVKGMNQVNTQHTSNPIVKMYLKVLLM